MPEIGYGYQLIQPRYQADTQNVQLIAQVLAQKEQEFSRAAQDLSGLRRQALNIRFINKGQQAVVDDFNRRISEQFDKGEFGDLSDQRVAAKYMNQFNEIGSNPALIANYRKDVEYQKMIQGVEAMRTSKDPAKAGFGAVNYANFMHRVNEYANLDLNSQEGQNYVLRPYTQYIDTGAELADRIKTVPIKKFSKERVENGYIVKDTYEGRDPNQVQALVRDYMGTRGVTQMRELAEYSFREAQNDPRFMTTAYDDYSRFVGNSLSNARTRLEGIEERLKTETDPAVVQNLSVDKAQLEKVITDAQGEQMSFEEFIQRDPEKIVADIAKTITYDAVNNTTDKYGTYSVSTTLAPDRTFLELQKMGQHVNEFNTQMKYKYDELAQRMEIARAKQASEGATSSDNQADGNQIPGETMFNAIGSGKSYMSVSDPTHISFVDTMDSATETLKRLYSQQSNFLESGLTEGADKITGANAGLELLINPKRLDSNPYYGESPYLRAWKIAYDELYKSRPDLAKTFGQRPQTDAGWNQLKEANSLIKARVAQMVERPQTGDEIAIANHLQDVNANKLSLEEFMRKANESGNPAEYMKNAQNIKIYPNAVYDFETPAGAPPKFKQAKALLQTTFRQSFENNLDIPYGVKNEGSIKVGDDEKTMQDIYVDPKRARTVPYDQIRKVETGPDGTIKVFFNNSAFQEYFVTGEDGKITDEKKSGVLSDPGAYYMVKDGAKLRPVTKEEIQATGYLEYKDPAFSRMNWSNQMGFTVGPTPQTRWDFSADRQSVPFKTRRSTLNDQVEVSIMDGPWRSMGTSDLTLAINQIRGIIGKATVEELRK